MDFIPNIQIFCCHYTSQQAVARGREGLLQDGMPAGVTINRLSCGGRLQVTTLLKAFEDGADGVIACACPPDKCHNVDGSKKAAKRAAAARKALEELGVEPERLAMHNLERGFHPEFVEAAQAMHNRIMGLGLSPFKGEDK
ncbi:MAG: hydrogenase iron-sulfur subunit [Thermodesulfobacteriota bacterium]